MKRKNEVLIIRLTEKEKSKISAYSNLIGSSQSEIIRNYINQLNLKND